MIDGKKENVLTVEIKACWASDFQKEVHEGSLSAMISSWLQFAESKHKKNIITIKWKEY